MQQTLIKLKRFVKTFNRGFNSTVTLENGMSADAERYCTILSLAKQFPITYWVQAECVSVCLTVCLPEDSSLMVQSTPLVQSGSPCT